MAATNEAFGIVGGEFLPFTPVSPDTSEFFRLEITLVSAEFKTQGSVAAASDSSVAAADCSAPDSSAEAIGATAPLLSCQGDHIALPQKKKKLADTNVYALPASSKKSAAFTSVVLGQSPESKITVSPDATVADVVEWVEGTCVAVFEQNFKELKRWCDEAEPRMWQREDLVMSVFQAKATKDKFIKDPANKKALGSVTVNLADFVSTAQPAEECNRQVTHTGPPHSHFSLTFRIKSSPISRQPPPGAQNPAARVQRSPELLISSAKSQLGNAQKGRELLMKLDPHCSCFETGSHIGIVVEEAWRDKGVMLLHRMSMFEACDPSAANYFGQVTWLHAAAGCVAMRIKCPENLNSKNGSANQESRFGWRLLLTCSSALKERLDTRSAPYSYFDLQNEPIFCLFPSGDAAEEDDNVAQQNEEGMKATARSAARSRAISEIAVKMAKVKRMAAQPLRVSYHQLGMMRLRQGFLIAQPLISDVIKRLFVEWNPDPDNNKCKDACARVFGTSEGPWDIFTIVKGLLFKPGIFQKLAERLGMNGTEKDSENCKLGSTLMQIYAVRNWWAHIQVTVANCRQALLAITDFITILPPELKVGRSGSIMIEMDGIIRSISQSRAHSLSMSVDDMAYFYFGCACRHLSHVSTSLLQKCPSLAFCAYLQQQIIDKDTKFRQKHIIVKQSSVIEVVDVTRALLALNQNQDHLLPHVIHVDSSSFNFDCETIRTVRNHFAHASEDGNSVFIVLLALGSLSRIISVVLRTCLHQADADKSAAAAARAILDDAELYCSEINEWQAMLLEKVGMLDTDALISAACQGYRDVLDANDYRQYARDSFQQLRLLVKGEIIGRHPIPSFASELRGINRSRERSILNFVARVPIALAKSVDSAVEWLVVQARTHNLHMQSAVSFFENEILFKKLDGSAFDAACNDDPHVSSQVKQDLAK
jgi:hypothetical protein